MNNQYQIIPPRIISKISPNDRMIAKSDNLTENICNYFGVGMSALSIINKVVTSNNINLNNILDFPCGHGRVTRFLRSAYFDKAIYASDLDTDGVSFCEQVFNAKTFESNVDFNLINTKGVTFDLIWVGSLLTHVNLSTAKDLLSFLHKITSENGFIIITTHGNEFMDSIQSRKRGLKAEQIEKLKADFYDNKYAFQPYLKNSNSYLDDSTYGLSTVSYVWMNEYSKEQGFNLVEFIDGGWCGQDVYILKK